MIQLKQGLPLFNGLVIFNHYFGDGSGHFRTDADNIAVNPCLLSIRGKAIRQQIPEQAEENSGQNNNQAFFHTLLSRLSFSGIAGLCCSFAIAGFGSRSVLAFGFGIRFVIVLWIAYWVSLCLVSAGFCTGIFC